jgi:hypothetical protein
MSEVINRDELIQTVAIKYGFILTKDDPLLVVLLLHHEILRQYQEMLLSGLDAVQLNLDAVYERHAKAVRDNAQHYVTQSLNALIQEHGKIQGRFEEMLAKERMAFRGMLSEKVGILQKWMWVSLGAAGVSLLGMLGTAIFIAVGGGR